MAKDKAAKGKRTTVSPASEASKVTPAPEKTKAKPGVVHAPSKGAAAADVKVAAQESKNRNADDAASTSSAKKAMSSKPTSPTAGAAKTKAATKTSAADAKAAKKRLITSVSDALAGGWKLGDAFRESFLGTQDYQQVQRTLQKALRADKHAAHAVNLLDNRGHLMNIVDEAVGAAAAARLDGGEEKQLQAAAAHWHMLKQKKKDHVAKLGGEDGLQKLKASKQAARAAKKARKAELMAMRAEKEAPERAAKAERRKLKELKHEARLKHLCLDYVQGRCPFGVKCNYSHEDPEDDNGELKAKNEKFAEEWQRKNKRKRHLRNADDPLGSSDEEEAEKKAKPAAKVSLRSHTCVVGGQAKGMGKGRGHRGGAALGMGKARRHDGDDKRGRTGGANGGGKSRGAGEGPKQKKPRSETGRHAMRAAAHAQKS